MFLFIGAILVGMFWVVFELFTMTGAFSSDSDAALFAAFTTGCIAVVALVFNELQERTK
jgi:hypothetical protein